jgi:hypothetical protein
MPGRSCRVVLLVKQATTNSLIHSPWNFIASSVMQVSIRGTYVDVWKSC